MTKRHSTKIDILNKEISNCTRLKKFTIDESNDLCLPLNCIFVNFKF